MSNWAIYDSFFTTQKWFPIMEEALNKALHDHSGRIISNLKPGQT